MSLNLNQLLPLIEEMPAYRKLVAQLKSPKESASTNVLDATKPYFIAALYQSLRRPIMVVTAQPEESKKLYEQLLNWCSNVPVRLFPEPDALPYERVASDNTTEIDRLQALSALSNISNSHTPPLVIASAPALAQKVTPYRDFTEAHHTIRAGNEIDPMQLMVRWQAIGYEVEDMVEIPGTISHRGGIIDIFPPTSELPARLEFFGDTIESIRFFDPTTQRSLKPAESLTVTPATELVTPWLRKLDLQKVLDGLELSTCNPQAREQFEQELTMLLNRESSANIPFYAPIFNQDGLLDYLPQDGFLVLDNVESIKSTVDDLDAKAEELRAEKLEQKELPCGFPRPYLTWEELRPVLEGRTKLALTTWETQGEGVSLGFTPTPSYAGQLPLFVKKAKEMLAQKQRLIVVSHQANRLRELLEEADILAYPVTEVKQTPPLGSLTLIQGMLAEGWIMNGNTHLLTDCEIFGFIKQRRVVKKHPVSSHRFVIQMKPGDYVVHIDHGIAKFAGVTHMGTAEGLKEFLVLEYTAGDKLYVPSDQIDRVSRYVGGGDQPPTLSRLGTQEWSKTKQRVKESVANVAKELLDLYAAREVVPGYAFSPDTIWQQEMETSFPYVETPDQMEIQQQVKEDMEKAKPMDRLVCGDVGYGKTEIAIRAAFKAVMNGKQVAVLVPTTVLAEQHLATFSQRMSAFPIKIEVLSRFRTPKQQQATIEKLAEGSVDICIGTHRLLQKDVAFKDLGLLIIDEEQRFGVAHKELLKQKRKEVDVLTLSATPIPRTMHMSLVGVRDMSVMETPPEDRLPIKTYVAEFNDRLVREAVLRELERNGQVFFVHNRVQSIAFVAAKLQQLVPEARVAIGHGQMPEGQLEKVMADFVQDKKDILVCTSIIESGLDMPRVNTLIVNQADKFGLSQLYQLRGRVGRGANLAYAYFLYDKGKHITPVAEKRLKTIFEATELGAGFGIAIKDLEIRGAGTLLGVHQSGHISAVGFDLYTQLLAQAVEELKAKRAGKKVEEVKQLPAPSINLPLPAYIPEDYVTDLNTRLGLYQKLVKLDKPEPMEALAKELTDRFGPLPKEVENLLYAVKIKALAAKASIETINTEEGQIVLSPFEGIRFDRKKLEPLLKDGIKFHPFQLTLNPKHFGKTWPKVLEEVVRRAG